MILRLITFILVSVSASAIASSQKQHADSISKSINTLLNPKAFHLCGGSNEGRSLDKLEGYRIYNVYAVEGADGKWQPADLLNGARKCVTVLSNKFGTSIEGRVRPKLDENKDDDYSQMDGHLMPGLIPNTRYAPIRTGYPTQPDQIYWAARGCSCIEEAAAAANGLSLLYIQRKESDASSRYEYAFHFDSEDPEITPKPAPSEEQEETPESHTPSNLIAQAIDRAHKITTPQDNTKHSEKQPSANSPSIPPRHISSKINPEAPSGNDSYKLSDTLKDLLIGPAKKEIIPLMERAAYLDKSGKYHEYLVRLEKELQALTLNGPNDKYDTYVFDETKVYFGPPIDNEPTKTSYTPKCGCLTEALKRHVSGYVPELSDANINFSSSSQPKGMPY